MNMPKYLIIGEEHDSSLSTDILNAVMASNPESSIHLEIDKLDNIYKLYEFGADAEENRKRKAVFESLPKERCHTNDLGSIHPRYATNPGSREVRIANSLYEDESSSKILLIGHSHIPRIVKNLVEEKGVDYGDIKIFVPQSKLVVDRININLLCTTNGYAYKADNIENAIKKANNYLQKTSSIFSPTSAAASLSGACGAKR